ncbi:hypothetical protein C1H46_041253 [Malus baccata]|uniref:CG-1 domain-containing protein n=1 Tax=Malus baccata TaxID=106549 RepID=A0A540KG60_MALBA|nr:hypothetical protein C1H46_041253 [Malus baccata]
MYRSRIRTYRPASAYPYPCVSDTGYVGLLPCPCIILEKSFYPETRVGGIDTLHCYYAHGEEDKDFQRRCYWMIDKKTEKAVSYLHEAQGSGLWLTMIADGRIPLFGSNSSNLGDDETACTNRRASSSVAVEPSHASFAKGQRAEGEDLFLDSTASGEGKSKVTPLATIEVDKDEEEEGNDINQVRKRPRVTCGQQVDSATQSHPWPDWMYPRAIDTAITNGATNDATALSHDDETTGLAAFHTTDPTVAATSAIGPTHLNPYSTANIADQAQDLQPPVLQPTATTGVVVLATTNETASSKSSNLALVQSEPNSNANQGLAQDIIESQEKETEPTSVEPENGKGKAVVQNDFGTGKSHESAEVRVNSSLKRVHELFGRVSATNPVASSSISTHTIDSQAKKKFRATLEMDFITMAGEVHRADMISGIHSLVDSNCFPTSTGQRIMAMLKQLEQYVPVYSKAYFEYDMGKKLTVQVEAMKQHLEPKYQLCDSKKREFQDLKKQNMRIEARQAAIPAEIDVIAKEIETILAQHQKLLLQKAQFKENEGTLKATLNEGDELWTTIKNIIHQNLPT